METAHGRDAVLNSKFWFRKDVFPTRTPRHSPRIRPQNGSASQGVSRISTPVQSTTPSSSTSHLPGMHTPKIPPVESEYVAMTIAEIINGTQSLPPMHPDSPANPNHNSTSEPSTTRPPDFDFPGLIPLVESYLSSIPNLAISTRCEIERYLGLIRKRADGTLWTNAKWIREYVRQHPEYKGDSVVNTQLTYDLCKEVVEITQNEGRDGKGWEMLGQQSQSAVVPDS